MASLAPAEAPIKPRLRGVSHGVAFFLAALAGIALVVAATGSTAKLACALYSASLCNLLGTSALYHLITWKPQARQRMRRLDHSAIFVLIAGTYTPLAITLDPQSAFRMLAVAWTCAALGVLKALLWVHGPKWIVALLAVGAGWVSVLYFGALTHTIGLIPVVLMVVGGVVYSLGALVYALKRPVLWAATFGYHELFHALVIAAAVIHFVAVSSSLGAMALT